MRSKIRTSWRLALKIFIVTASFVMLYPILIWIISGNCKEKFGVVDTKIVAEYVAINNPSSKIRVKRFISTELFRTPFYHQKRFEFFILEANESIQIKQLKMADKMYNMVEPHYSKKFDRITPVINIQLIGEEKWEEFKLVYKNLELINSPAPKIIEKITYGPTFTDLSKVCN